MLTSEKDASSILMRLLGANGTGTAWIDATSYKVVRLERTLLSLPPDLSRLKNTVEYGLNRYRRPGVLVAAYHEIRCRRSRPQKDKDLSGRLQQLQEIQRGYPARPVSALGLLADHSGNPQHYGVAVRY